MSNKLNVYRNFDEWFEVNEKGNFAEGDPANLALKAGMSVAWAESSVNTAKIWMDREEWLLKQTQDAIKSFTSLAEKMLVHMDQLEPLVGGHLSFEEIKKNLHAIIEGRKKQ